MKGDGMRVLEGGREGRGSVSTAPFGGLGVPLLLGFGKRGRWREERTTLSMAFTYP